MKGNVMDFNVVIITFKIETTFSLQGTLEEAITW